MTRNRMMLAAALLLAVCAPAWAQQALKIAVVDTAKVFNDMQETRDLKQKMDADRRTIQATDQQKAQDVQAKKDARDQLKPDSPQFQARNDEFLRAAIDYKAWQELTKMEVERQQKTQIRNLYQRIQEGVAELAQQRGLDLVLVQTDVQLPTNLEGINLEQLNRLIGQQNVLYASANVDITADVVAHLDARYKNAGGGQ